MPDGIQDRTVNPIFTLVCRQIVHLTVLAELILAPILIYVILNYSRQVQSYKYFLLNNIIWCLTYAMLVASTNAHIRFPAPCITFAPLFLVQNFPATAMSAAFLGCGLNMAISTAWGLVQRLAFATNGPFVRRIRRHPHRYVLAIIAYHILVTTTYLYAFQKVVITDRERLYDEFTMRVPHLKFLANTTLYACVEYLPNTRLYCYLTALVCVFFICLEFIAFAVLYREVHRNSAKLSLQTHRMQLVLLRAVAFQLLNYFVIVILPVVLSTIAFGVQFKYTEELTTLTETCLTLHGIIDYVCILYFITPYRRAVGRLVRWQKKVKSESVVVATRRLNVSQRSI